MAYDTNYYTRKEVERILRVAYQYAMQRRKHLTVVDKANVLASSRLWRAVAQEIAPQYPEVTTDYMYVDNAAMRMIQEPKFFDVMVTENTFGDILTDEGSCITGSMGLLPSASTGEHTPVFDKVFNRIFREELFKFSVQLASEGLIVRKYQSGPVQGRDDIGHGKGLAGSRNP